jgi:hypothetical protein
MRSEGKQFQHESDDHPRKSKLRRGRKSHKNVLNTRGDAQLKVPLEPDPHAHMGPWFGDDHRRGQEPQAVSQPSWPRSPWHAGSHSVIAKRAALGRVMLSCPLNMPATIHRRVRKEAGRTGMQEMSDKWLISAMPSCFRWSQAMALYDQTRSCPSRSAKRH